MKPNQAFAAGRKRPRPLKSNVGRANTMNENQIIQTIKNDIASAKNSGSYAIDVESLINYIESIEQNLNQKNNTPSKEESLERFKALNANSLAHYNWVREQDIELFKSVILSGQSSLKAVIILHGGAAVALLAFIGHLIVNSGTRFLIAQFSPVMTCFLVGVLLGVISHGSTYFAQYSFHRKWNTFGNICNIFTIFLTTLSYLIFAYSCFLNYCILKSI